MVLTQEDIDACRAAFQAFDTDKTGTLDVAALRGVLGFLGQKPTEDELFMMIAEVDEGMSGMLDFGELLWVIEVQKAKALAFDDEGDMVDAFVACGGRADRQGHVKRETLVRIIKKDFGLMIDIEELINKVDTDGYVHSGGRKGGLRRKGGFDSHVLFFHISPFLTHTGQARSNTKSSNPCSPDSNEYLYKRGGGRNERKQKKA
jgi:calmodulin